MAKRPPGENAPEDDGTSRRGFTKTVGLAATAAAGSAFVATRSGAASGTATDATPTDDGSTDEPSFDKVLVIDGTGDAAKTAHTDGCNSVPVYSSPGPCHARVPRQESITPEESYIRPYQYRFTVSGDVARNEAYSEVRGDEPRWDLLEDGVDEGRVAGIVANGVDAFDFSGRLTDIEVRGDATFTVVRS